ncbi:MAG TPA: response regulator transcription factor [Thermoanaerobaculia bacterium]|jgi:DNA-binding response OmpR family regulator
MPRVLIVEDDESMSVALRDGFVSEGYDVRLVKDGESGLDAARREPPDLLVLDVMLPKKTGLDVCRELRGAGSQIPIIMLTARGQELDKVVGLRAGADDYVTKPFGFLELVARVEALLRRTGGASPDGPVRFGDIELDIRRHRATRGGDELELTAREFRLLAYFLRHRGEVVSREQLLDAVWEYRHAPLTRTVDMHVAKLRKKIEPDPHAPRFLLTVHGIGYKFTG